MDDGRLRDLLAMIEEAPEGFIDTTEASREEGAWLINEGLVENTGIPMSTMHGGERTLYTEGSGVKSYMLHLTPAGQQKLAQLRR